MAQEAELDLEDARRRLVEAAEEAKRLEEQNAGFAVFEAWDRYQLIANAIAAQERDARARTEAGVRDRP
jgi:hypothetical protein